MKKMLIFAASMIILLSFFASCSVEYNNIVFGSGFVDVKTTGFENTMPEAEINEIENSEILQSADYEIYELRFSSYSVYESSKEFTITNNANYYFVFGLKNKNSGDIYYKDIPVSDWEFSSDNTAVTKKENTGFTAGSSFYSDNNANISVDVFWKGLHKNFKFVLKSNKENPSPDIVAFRWVLYEFEPPYSEPYVYTDGLTADQLNDAVLDTAYIPVIDSRTIDYSVTSTELIAPEGISVFIKKNGSDYIISGDNVNYYCSATLDGSPVTVYEERRSVICPENFPVVYYVYDVANVYGKAPGKCLLITRTFTSKHNPALGRISKIFVNYF